MKALLVIILIVVIVMLGIWFFNQVSAINPTVGAPISNISNTT